MNGYKLYSLTKENFISDTSFLDKFRVVKWRGKDGNEKFCYSFNGIRNNLFTSKEIRKTRPIFHMQRKNNDSKVLTGHIKAEYFREKLDIILNYRNYIFNLFCKHLNENYIFNQDCCDIIYDFYLKSLSSIKVNIPYLDLLAHQPKFYFINTGISIDIKKKVFVKYGQGTIYERLTQKTVSDKIKTYLVFFGECPFFHKIPLPDK